MRLAAPHPLNPHPLFLGAALGAVAAPAFAQGLPGPVHEAVRAMIAKAAESDDPAVFAAVVAVAKDANPDAAAEIDAIADAAGDMAAQSRIARINPPPPAPAPPRITPQQAVLAQTLVPPPPKPIEWKGTMELGGSRSTGSTEAVGIYGALDVSRVGPNWTHRLVSRGDYQETNRNPTTERFNAAYEPRVNLRPGLYAFGLAQYEHDRFLGYRHRYTTGLGAGLKVIDKPQMKVDVDLGPALRFTDFYLLEEEQTVAGRGNINIRWLPTDRITVSQEATIYAEDRQTSAKSVTAVETMLFGPLKARLSYNLQYERDSRISRSDLDGITRATLLYTF